MTKYKSKARRRAGSDIKHDRQGLKAKRIYAKKGGAGGNFTWGKPGDEVYIPDINEGDPNYDSADESNAYFTISFDEALDSKHDFSYLAQNGEDFPVPKLNLKDFKSAICKDINQFFISGDYEDFADRVACHESVLLHYALVKKLLEVSMEKTDNERELASQAMIELQMRHLLPFTQIAKGFERLFETIDDLSLDIPNAKAMLARFLARCVADDVIPPAFLTDKYIERLGTEIVVHAKVLLSMKHGLGRLEHVWGAHISSSVDQLKEEIKTLILEYLNSADAGEVTQLLRNMNVPFFHHEVVKRGIMIALEHKEREQAMISVLLKQLVTAQVISTQQLQLGFQRLYQEMDDIVLDNPDANVVVGIFAEQAIKDKCLTEEDLRDAKEKARLVSEQTAKWLAEQFQVAPRRRVGSNPN